MVGSEGEEWNYNEMKAGGEGSNHSKDVTLSAPGPIDDKELTFGQ